MATTFKVFLAEKRKDDGKYKETKVKGEIEKVILELEGTDAAVATKLMKRYKRLEISLKKMEKAKGELNDKLRGMIEGAFDDEADQYITRVLATTQFVTTLAKKQQAKTITEVDYEKVMEGILQLVDKGLLPKIDELIKANTKEWVREPPKATLAVRQVEEAVGVIDAAKGALGSMMKKLQDFMSKFKAKFRIWAHDYDAKLRELKDELKQLERAPVTESVESTLPRQVKHMERVNEIIERLKHELKTGKRQAWNMDADKYLDERLGDLDIDSAFELDGPDENPGGDMSDEWYKVYDATKAYIKKKLTKLSK